MKKIVSLIILSVMLVLTLAACGGNAGFDYKANASQYVISLPDYKANNLKANIAKLNAIITDDDVKEEINNALISGSAYREKITTGTIGWGDTIGLTYKGVLASNVEALKNSDSETLDDILTRITEEQIKKLTAFSGGEATTEQKLEIGSGSFIAGFEEAMVGMEIGKKNQSLVVTFPEDYKEKTLAGKKAVFFVSPINKIRLEAERDLAFKDKIAFTYETVIDEEFISLKDYFDDETTEPVTSIVTLSQDSQFHSALIIAFNKARLPLEEGGAVRSAFGVELKFDEEYTVSVPKPDDSGKEQRQILVHHTVTVHSLAEPVYYTADEAAAGTLEFKDFLTYLGLKEADYKDKKYDDYFTEKKTDMQKTRTLQIKANRYQAAFDALVDAAELKMDDPEIRATIQSYIDEVNGNIDYMVTYYRASGYASVYESMLSYYGCKDLKEYVMYTMYGYKYSTINAQLKTDAEEYVAGRLVFWTLVNRDNFSLTDAEYNAKLEEYKKLYENDNFVTENNITEEALREAMLWDKVVGSIAGDFNEDNSAWVDAYVIYTEKDVKEDK